MRHHFRPPASFGARWRGAALAAALLVTGGLTSRAQAATISVTTTAEEINANAECSLREAIESANRDTNVVPDPSNSASSITTACAPGSGADIIELPFGAVFPMASIMNDVVNPVGPTATPYVYSHVVIEANGSRLEHAPNGVHFRAFAVGPAFNLPGGSLTIRNAHIKGFTVKGGNGADGGGGGLGAGGAIYVVNGALTVESCTFEGNGATGGNGSSGAFTAGGGGGGLGGNGGGRGPSGLSGGGGGGGARGDGGDGGSQVGELSAGGGGGGGTVLDGNSGDVTGAPKGEGGLDCGGHGGECCDICLDQGFGGDDGNDGFCPGGGGGGGASYRPLVCILFAGSGGDGAYGGGGGGSGTDLANGGHGGFGGGGGAGDVTSSALDGFGPDGGDGGFGGGGGAAHGGYISGGPGSGGSFAGDASTSAGGGGAGLGGAIFSDGGTVTVYNCTFTANSVMRGLGGGGGANDGREQGAAIFSVDGTLTVLNSTIAGNLTNAEGGGIVFYGSTRNQAGRLAIHNTIIANNVVGAAESPRQCSLRGDLDQVAVAGSGNLIVNNSGCPGLVSQADPVLAALQLNGPGLTPTMAIKTTSPAFGAADDATCLAFDQRGVVRPQCARCDIGAYEFDCAPQVQVAGDVTLPDTCVGGTSTARLDVCNTGKEDLEVGAITSSDPTQFAVTTPSSGYPVIVSPDFCFPFQVVFSPVGPAGLHSATLTLATNDPVSPSVEVGASGLGTEGDIRVTGSTEFGDQCAGSFAEKAVSVCNVGGCNLAVTEVAFDPACLDFALINSPFPATVSPDSCLALTVRFTPTSAGPKSCTLVVTSSDPDSPTVTRTVTANTPAASIDVPPDLAFPPTVTRTLGACQSLRSFPVSNTGACDLRITSLALAGVDGADYSFVALPSYPIILEPGHVAGDGGLKVALEPSVLDRDRLGSLAVTYVSDPVTGATTTVNRALCGEGVSTGARVLVRAQGVPVEVVDRIQLLRVNANRKRKSLDTTEVALRVALQTVIPPAPCPSFQFHREYGTVDSPVQLLPGSYQVSVTILLNGKRVSKTVGFSVDTCDFNPTIVIDF